MDPSHHRKLENMYRCSPCNEFYEPQIVIGDGTAEVTFAVRPEFHHAAGTLHGSVYFKALDDAAYFAAASLRDGHFLVTSTFTTYLTRPVAEGRLAARGRVLNATRGQVIAEAVLYDDREREVARGSGLFVPGRMRLDDALGYCLPETA
jgi:uncharacterized protein (TIGR00369 family)